MTQHPLQEHTEDDKRIMRRLFMVVGAFMVASAAMAVVIAVVFA